MRILMIGAGATGGYFGGRLAEAGRDLTFLVRGRRAEQLRRNGLQLLSPFGDVTLHPKLIASEELRNTEPFDLILLSTKAYSLDAAMEDFAPAVGPHTSILPMLNGLRHLDSLDGRFGKEHVLGGSCRIVADLDPEGRIEQQSRLGEVAFGERDGQPSDRISNIAQALRVPGFVATLAPDILAFMWQKWWILSSIGAVCILGRGTTGQVAGTPYGPELAQAVIAESTAIAAANGYPADSTMLREHIARLTERGATLTSSLYRDMLKDAPVEADHILGDLLTRRHKVAAPLLTAAFVQLGVYERQRQSR